MSQRIPPAPRARALRVQVGWCAVVVIAASLAGCGGSAHQAAPRATVTPTTEVQATPTPAGSVTPSPTVQQLPTATLGPNLRRLADLAAGRALVQAQCAACHALSDAGISDPAQPIAPALDHAGARYTRATLAAVLVNPCAVARPGASTEQCSQMPAFADLTQQQRDQLVLYLLSLH